MPVETLVIVPTSRGVSCGVNASRTWLIPANALSKSLWRLSGSIFIGSLPRGLGSSGLGSGLASGLLALSSVRPTPFSSDAR